MGDSLDNEEELFMSDVFNSGVAWSWSEDKLISSSEDIVENVWALHHLKYRPVPCLLQLCHNCWQNCQHHPGLQIGVFHVWVFLNYALCPSFCTVQSTHPCFQWEHHHPVQKRGEKRKIDIKKNSNNNMKLILQNYSTSVKDECILCAPKWML